MKILIGIPAFNEEKNIGAIVAKLKEKYDYVLVCDDGSSDMTSNIASALGAIVVKHEKNIGYWSRSFSDYTYQLSARKIAFLSMVHCSR